MLSDGDDGDAEDANPYRRKEVAKISRPAWGSVEIDQNKPAPSQQGSPPSATKEGVNASRRPRRSSRLGEKVTFASALQTTPSTFPRSIYDLRTIVQNDMAKFVMEPLSPGNGMLKCRLKREKRVVSGSIYRLYVQHPGELGGSAEREGKRTEEKEEKNGGAPTREDLFLLAAKKRAGQRHANVTISLQRNAFSKDARFAKLRGNFFASEFTLYDGGANPSRSAKSNAAAVRNELACVHFGGGIISSEGPRRMVVAIPRVTDGVAVTSPDDASDAKMLRRLKEDDMKDLQEFINKAPRWNEELDSYELDFNGRVKVSSAKNFQLIDTRADSGRVLLQLGKVSRGGDFILDFSYPFSPLQAMGIALASFEFHMTGGLGS